MKPEALEAEQAVLSALIQNDPEAADDAFDVLLAEDFARAAHREMFAAMKHLHAAGQPIDPITLKNELVSRGTLEAVGGVDALGYLLDVVPTGANVAYHAAIVRNRALERRLLDAASDIATLASGRKAEAEALAGQAEAVLLKATERANPVEAQPVRETMFRVGELVESRRGNDGQLLGIGTGLKELDRITGGWRNGQMIVIAARPGEGKTSFALRCAHYASVALKVPTALFSIEMGADEIGFRLLASHVLIDLWRLERGLVSDGDIARIARATGTLGQAPLWVDETAERTVGSLRAAARRMHRKHGIRLVIVDYVQLLDGDEREENRQQEMRMVSKGLRAMAKQLQIPVLALCQVNRAKEQRGPDSRPRLSDLKESGAWEQDAHVVVFPWTNPDDVPKYPTDAPVPTTLIVGKNRNGPTGDVKVNWDRKTGSWKDFTQMPGESAA